MRTHLLLTMVLLGLQGCFIDQPIPEDKKVKDTQNNVSSNSSAGQTTLVVCANFGGGNFFLGLYRYDTDERGAITSSHFLEKPMVNCAASFNFYSNGEAQDKSVQYRSQGTVHFSRSDRIDFANRLIEDAKNDVSWDYADEASCSDQILTTAFAQGIPFSFDNCLLSF